MVWTKYYVNYHNFFNFFMYTFIFYEIISSHLVYLFLWRYATYIYTCTIFASQTLILLFNIAYFKKTLGNVLISWHLKNVSCFFFFLLVKLLSWLWYTLQAYGIYTFLWICTLHWRKEFLNTPHPYVWCFPFKII